ncbi:OmpA family protein [Hymenobacter caeli]|uniref:Outer membrane protein OmpA-like peptidoglycan-associated protein n=1 Tax=Hymenobacter caeli TaxID=2735894 RepID=A0ABX2FV28_9BACT|nr:OmpA family protein [Hymenobacter caeli]NRT20346.1 outer membrane protein OmpA-like peptidoglycan-associated protein [Hymenobacter caeli]
MTTPKSLLSIFMACVLLFSSCASSRQPADTSANGTGVRKTGMNKATKGGLLGAGGGAAAGALLGGLLGGGRGTAIGAILGAAAGGGAGVLIGRKMDKQAADLQRDMQNAKVERVGEGIKITFDSGILFDTNSATLRAASQADIVKMAATLQKYPDTNVLVEGHTDNTGTDAINLPLSERRAQSVADATVAQGVSSSRITTKGLGSSDPVGDNTTVEGKQANRRVEIAIFANEKMKKAAENGTL